MKAKFLMLAFVVASLFAFTPFANTAKAQNPTQNIPLTGNILSGGSFAGTFDITRFVSQNGTLYAVGTLTGTLTDAVGTVLGSVTNLPVRLPVSGTTGSCSILHLDLGPLNLDLLGLQVHLDQVVLDITAQSGSGKLLGNLLCAVAHLLDSSASTNALAQLLNQILGAL